VLQDIVTYSAIIIPLVSPLVVWMFAFVRMCYATRDRSKNNQIKINHLRAFVMRMGLKEGVNQGVLELIEQSQDDEKDEQ